MTVRRAYGRMLAGAATLFAVGCAGTVTVGAQAPPRATRILILYAPAPESPSSAMWIERFRTTLRSELAPPVEFFEEFLDLDRFPNAQRRPQLAGYFSDKYEGLKLDLVMCMGSAALHFAVDHLRAIMPEAPIVFGMTYAHRVNVTELPANVTGRTIRITLRSTLAMARRLQPDADRVVVIAGTSAVDSIALSGALHDAAQLRDSIRIDPWQGLPYDSLLGALRAVSRRTIVFFAHLRKDGHGRTLVPLEIMSEIARASRAPVYSYVDKLMGMGIVGGAMVRHDDEAVQTARLAVRVLRREAGAPMPAAEESHSVFMADWRVLRRFRLNASRLVPGTEVLFRTPSAWERHREVILIALLVIFVEALLIGLLLLERRRRIRAQREVADQAKYERTIAELMTDAARYAPENAPRALEDAIGRLGRYADAQEIMLVQYSEGPSRRVIRLQWARGDPGGSLQLSDENDSGAVHAPVLELPLIVAGKAVGLLRLSRSSGAEPWQPQLVERLGAAVDVIASAVARSSAMARAEEAGRQVAHMGRVAMIGELASTISHELRQPLAAIRINVQAGKQLLARKPFKAAVLWEVLEDIILDNDRATEVIEHVRSLLRKEAPAIAAVDLNAICFEAADLLRRDALSRGIRLDVSLDPQLSPVEGHSIELQQVVINLLLNALDATATSSGERWVGITTTALDGLVELVVSDSGPGVSAEARDRLFESFFTTKAHGLGMGLVIVRSIVERHQGRIEVENGEQGGAILRIRLPALGEAEVDGTKDHELVAMRGVLSVRR